MNSKRFATTIIVFAVIISSFLLSVSALDVQAVVNKDPKDNISAQGAELEITKFIYSGGAPYVYYESYIGDSFKVKIIYENKGSLPIYNLTITSPEANITGNFPQYDEDWFEITGELERNVTVLPIGVPFEMEYFITPKHQGNFTFTASNASYTYNDIDDYSLSGEISYIAYKTEESIVVEKYLVIDGIDYQDGRAAIENVIQVKVKITNFYNEYVNLSITDTAPGDNETFTFNETNLLGTRNFLGPNETYSGFSYDLEPLVDGDYIIPKCTVFGDLEFGNSTTNDSKTVNLEVFTPIYDGPDWTQKVPLLTIEKSFYVDGEKLYTLEITDNNFEPIMVQINVSNHGVVMAQNLFIYEEAYSEWVFDTRGLQVWDFLTLNQSEYYIANYTITPKILGTFNIERTEVIYDFQNQYDLLMEEGYTIYSNIIVLTAVEFKEEPTYTEQWWIAIGISFGVILLAVIPTIVTFVTYGRRKKIQKGT